MKALLHQETIVVRYGDMDSLNHVNNAMYFIYFEQARAGWFNKHGLRSRTDNIAPVLIKTQAIFLKSIIYPETITVRVYATAVGNSSLNTSYTIHSKQDDSIVYAKGTAKIVWVDLKKESSVPLPDDVRQLLKEYGD